MKAASNFAQFLLQLQPFRFSLIQQPHRKNIGGPKVRNHPKLVLLGVEFSKKTRLDSSCTDQFSFTASSRAKSYYKLMAELENQGINIKVAIIYASILGLMRLCMI